MQKWMGFFLSEHTTSLGEEKYRVDLTSDSEQNRKIIVTFSALCWEFKESLYSQTKTQKVTLIGEVERNFIKEGIPQDLWKDTD